MILVLWAFVLINGANPVQLGPFDTKENCEIAKAPFLQTFSAYRPLANIASECFKIAVVK